MCMLYFIDWSSLKQREGFFVFLIFLPILSVFCILCVYSSTPPLRHI